MIIIEQHFKPLTSEQRLVNIYKLSRIDDWEEVTAPVVNAYISFAQGRDTPKDKNDDSAVGDVLRAIMFLETGVWPQ